MHKINNGRMILAGIVTAVILTILSDIDNGLLLAQGWADALKALNLPALSTKAIIAFNVASVVAGLLSLWLYVAARPRLGAGPKTALTIAGVVWVFGWPMAMLPMAAIHVISKSLATKACLLGILEIGISMLAGAAIYKEETTASGKVSTATA